MPHLSQRRQFGWLQRLLFRVAVWHEYRDLRISATERDAGTREAQLQRVRAAVDLLAEHAPAQVGHMRHRMPRIFIGRLAGRLATWNEALGACVLSAEWVADKDTRPEEIASTLVHEVTHARLWAAGFRYHEAVRARIERVCFLAERNWARRLPRSPARAALEAQVASYLALPRERYSDAARQAQREAARRSWPGWQRALDASFRAVQRIARTTTGRSGSP